MRFGPGKETLVMSSEQTVTRDVPDVVVDRKTKKKYAKGRFLGKVHLESPVFFLQRLCLPFFNNSLITEI